MNGAEITAAVIAAAAVLIAGILSRRSSREANEIDRFEASLAGLEKRIDSLERELTAVKAAYVGDQRDHAQARGLFRVSTRYIRELRAWLDDYLEGNHEDEPPPVPDVLVEWI